MGRPENELKYNVAVQWTLKALEVLTLSVTMLSPHKVFSFLLEVNYGAVKHCQTPLLTTIHGNYSNHVR